MRYKLLGKSGLRVSEICLGTMTFGTEYPWGSSKEDSRKVFDCFREHGGNFIDTANFYTFGTSEKYLGEFIKEERNKLVVATKYTLDTGAGDVNCSGNHRKNMFQAVEASLKSLRTDYIDLLWLHAWDFTTPIDEVMRAFDDLVSQGKVLYIGISDTPAWIVSAANMMSELRGWNKFVGMQIEYSLRQRSPERDLLPMARHFQIGVTAWSPLAAGVLTGKFNTGKGAGSRIGERGGPKERDLKIAQKVVDVAQAIGRPPSQVALNWLRQGEFPVIPIVGSRSVTQLKENLGCLEFALDAAQLKELTEATEIELGFPHEFLKGETIQKVAFGGALSKIDYNRY
jgi:aryl-alcohol dehydrogenase-like predicted oxidoreductase